VERAAFSANYGTEARMKTTASSEKPELEKELHERFADDRLHGEWFMLTERIRNFIHGELGEFIQ
jgi:hypothetical protein